MKSLMACCGSCHRHVNARELACPFCRGPIKTCQSATLKALALGTSLIAGASLLTACPQPVYGPPAPWSPSPSLAPSAAPSATPTP